ncbi:hypothetical protein EV182_008748, partial [Spiromyces aspiralis]
YIRKIDETITGILNTYKKIQVNAVKLERVGKFMALKQEADYESRAGPPPGWPWAGHIRFERVSARHSTECYDEPQAQGSRDPEAARSLANGDGGNDNQGLPKLALSDVTLNIPPGTRVGVVGRTGAGKSTLAKILARLVEPESGRVTIDGVDIGAVGLGDLRRGVTMITQEA